MPPFVVLKHEASEGTHFDFMLRVGEVLRTWALPQEPAVGMEILGHKLPDHRLAYLDYEGPVSGGRGSVSRFDSGDYRVLRRSGPEMEVFLSGERLAGRVSLRRAEGEPDCWILSFSPNDAATGHADG